MTLHTEWLRYGEDQRYMGYVARQDNVKGPLPAVIVLQEIWGVDDHIQDVTRRLANAGYVAFAPDLFAEKGEREAKLRDERIDGVKNFLDVVPSEKWHDPNQLQAELESYPAENKEQIRETLTTLIGGLNPAAFLDQMVETSAFLRNQYKASAGRSVGSVGFCLGGLLSAMLAGADEQLDGAILFYGQPPAREVAEKINCPVLGFYGGSDDNVTGKIPQFDETMKELGKSFEYHVYDGAPHAFFNDTRVSYHVDAARDSFARALVFFKEQLV